MTLTSRFVPLCLYPVGSACLLLLCPGSSLGQTATSAIASGNWGVGSNWSAGAPINSTFDPTVNGFNMTLDSTYTVGSLTMTSGIIGSGVANNLTMSGASTWTAGTIGSAGSINFNNSLLINNSVDVNVSSANFNLAGVTNWTGSANIVSNSSSAAINNLNTGTFVLNNNSSLINNFPGTFNNSGTLRKNAAFTGTTTVNWAFNNTGTIDMQGGILSLTGGGNWGGSVTNTTAFNNNNAVSLTTGTFTLQNGGTTSNLNTNISATVNIASGATYNFNSGGSLNLSSGTLGGVGNASSILNINSNLNWTGGGMGGLGTTTIAGGGSISGTSDKNVNSTSIQLNSTVTWSGSGNIVANVNGAGITALTGSLLDVQTNASLVNNFIGTYTNNTGATFRKTFLAGTTTVNWGFNNSGTIDVQIGNVDFKGGGNLGGTLSVSNNATATYSTGTFTLISGGNANGSSGNVNVTGATLNISNGGTYNFNAMTIGLSSGFLGSSGTGASVLNINNSSTLNWTGGSLGGAGTTNILNGATVNTSGASNKNVNTASLVIAPGNIFTFGGTGNLVANTSSAAITNNGQFNITGDGSLINNFIGTFTNNGTFQKNTATGNSTINWNFNNNGTVNVTSGTVTFSSNTGGSLGGVINASSSGNISFTTGTYTLLNSGQINNLGGGTILFNGAQMNLANGASYLINGGAGVTLSSGQIGGLGTGASSLTISNNFNWTGGGLGGNGSVNNAGTINASGVLTKNVNTATFLNTSTGTIILSGIGDFISNTNGSGMQNSGLFDIQGNAGFTNNFPGTFTNNSSGIFRKSSGVGSSIVFWSFTNNGSVQANSGVIQFTTYSQGATGSLALSNNSTVNFQSNPTIQGSISGIGNIITGTISHSNGTISPGQSPGQLNITANLTMSSTSTLAVEIGGLTQGSQYDFLNVTGTSNLNNAALIVNFFGGFQNSVASGNTFTILTAGGGLSGTFNGLPNGTLFTSNDGFGQFIINYTGNSVILTASVPEPTTIALAISTAALAGGWYWRKRKSNQKALEQDVAIN